MIDLISVIVPVYNVEAYLERCVRSIMKQTFTYLDIVLVDDGSKDNCPALCDQLAEQDPRICVVHKKNGGLSSARNAGIDIAKGEYLIFVDSDDWLHPEYVENLYGEAIRSGNKIIIGEFVRISEHTGYGMLSRKFENIPMDKAIPRMLKGEWISACAKLYHRSLFDNIRFPIGRNNEDYAILVYLFEQCESVSYTKDVIYFYFSRVGSITHSSLNPHSFDEYINGIEVYDYCKQKYPQWADLALSNLAASIIKLTGQCLVENKFMEKYDEMREYACVHKLTILFNPSLNVKYKPFILSMMIGKSVHQCWLKFYRSVIFH